MDGQVEQARAPAASCAPPGQGSRRACSISRRMALGQCGPGPGLDGDSAPHRHGQPVGRGEQRSGAGAAQGVQVRLGRRPASRRAHLGTPHAQRHRPLPPACGEQTISGCGRGHRLVVQDAAQRQGDHARVLGVLAFEFRDEPELASITKCWNRVKPSDRPKDGEALENDLVEFRLPQQRASPPPGQRLAPYAGHSTHPHAYNAHLAVTDGWHAPPQPIAALQPLQPPQLPRHRAGQDAGAHQATAYEARPWAAAAAPAPPAAREHRRNEANDVVSNLEALAAESMDRRSASLQGSDASCRTPNEVVTQEEDMRRLHEECHMARSNASVLMDTLVHEGLHAETAELVDEFYRRWFGRRSCWRRRSAGRLRRRIGRARVVRCRARRDKRHCLRTSWRRTAARARRWGWWTTHAASWTRRSRSVRSPSAAR